MPLQLQELTDKILRIYYKVYNELGYGFLEKVYHNALLIELNQNGLNYESKKQLKVYYSGHEVGEYYPDIIINNSIILEIKASEILAYENECQLINYLRSTEIEIGLLLNFGKKPEFKRKYFTNDRKKIRLNQ
jgi:GxxExxY protein